MRMFGIGVALVMSVSPFAVSAGTDAEDAANKTAALVAAEISTFANQLSLRPETAIDFSKVSGEYCFYSGWTKSAAFAVRFESLQVRSFPDNHQSVISRKLCRSFWIESHFSVGLFDGDDDNAIGTSDFRVGKGETLKG